MIRPINRWLRSLGGLDRIEGADRAAYASSAYANCAERAERVAWVVLLVDLPLFALVDYATWADGDWAAQPAHERIFWWRLALTLGILGLLGLRPAVADRALRDRLLSWGSVVFYPAMGVWFVLVCQSLITDASVYVLFLMGVSVLAPLPSRLKLLVYPIALAGVLLGFELMRIDTVESFHVTINAMAGAVGALLMDLVASRGHVSDFVQRRLLDQERKHSDQVLRNILPAGVVRRLKQNAGAVVDYHPAVSLLFADLAGFGRLTQTLPPQEMIGLLDQLFLEFDEAADRFGAEKIKTIGDSYMAACGVPFAVEDHARRVADLAMRMQSIARRVRADRSLPVHLRIGLHTGPAVAGVIGRRKFSYDLWGETVNIAAHLQSFSEPDRIHVSTQMQALLLDDYRFEARAPISFKGREPVATHFLLGRRRDAERYMFASAGSSDAAPSR